MPDELRVQLLAADYGAMLPPGRYCGARAYAQLGGTARASWALAYRGFSLGGGFRGWSFWRASSISYWGHLTSGWGRRSFAHTVAKAYWNRHLRSSGEGHLYVLVQLSGMHYLERIASGRSEWRKVAAALGMCIASRAYSLPLGGSRTSLGDIWLTVVGVNCRLQSP